MKDWRHNAIRQTRLSLIAALLALLWNVGSLLVLASSRRESESLEAVVIFSFSVLSLLPAVLLHLVVRHRHRIWILAGYGVSAGAILLHVCELTAAPSRLHQLALLIIAVGFLIIIGSLMIIVRSEGRGFHRDSELVSLACLLLFSLSFIHFGYGHAAPAWTAEIAWHHAGIPLALFVLLQDYRFLLLDVFLRFLLNFGLAAVYVLSGFAIALHLRSWPALAEDKFWLGIVLVAACLVLISFAFVRARLQRWMTARLFRRQGITDCEARLNTAVARVETEEQLLVECASLLAGCISVGRFDIRKEPATAFDSPFLTENAPKTRIYGDLDWVEAVSNSPACPRQ